jgi:hypothetical protein
MSTRFSDEEKSMHLVMGSDVLLHEPAASYHARASQYLSSHQLANFRRCPLLYQRRKSGLVKDDDRPAFVVGRAAHTLILEGQDRFDEDYAVGGPVNPRTGARFGSATKAYAEWAEAQRRPVLTDGQFDLVCRMADSVRAHALATDLLSAGVAEGVVRATYRDLPCQIRMDWFDPHRGIVDLKTCDDLTWFEADARRYDYVHQVAFYRAVLAQVIGLSMPVHIIAVEKKEPFRCGVWNVDVQALAIAQGDNERAMERLQQCQAAGVWPTGYEEARLLQAVA